MKKLRGIMMMPLLVQSRKRMMIAFLYLLLFVEKSNAQTILHASGSRIMDAGNNEVLLHGMNLGGWLQMEGYMLQTDGNYGQWQIKRDMHLQGATESEIELFFSSWRNNHTTAADINYLKSLGLNCLRLPMHYELFLTASQRTTRSDVAYGKISVTTYIDSLERWYDRNLLFTDITADGFSAIDKTLGWAGSNAMWVILDLHAAPGGQGSQISISDALVELDLWNRTDSKGRKIYQLVTERLWKAISGRYKTDARIAMYDLLNEPNGPIQISSIKALYDNLIAAIRNNGDNHLILLEGNGFGNVYTGLTPDLFPVQQNLVWSGHRYWVPNDPTFTGGNANELHLIAGLANFRTKWNVPVWVGETGENSNHWISQACKALQDLNIGWCLWTHKRLGPPGNSFFQTSSLMRVKHANIYTAVGRTALSNSVLYENCVKQKDYEYAMTKVIGSEISLPYNGTAAIIPGKIFASEYDLGKNGIAYADAIYEMTVYNGPYWNSGFTYRNDGVDIEVNSDTTGNGFNVGWMEVNDWMNYTVDVRQTGNYTVQLRVAHVGIQNASLAIKVDGKVLDTVVVPVPAGTSAWTTVALGHAARLTTGTHVIQVLTTAAGVNLSWINFTLNGAASGSALQVVPNPVRDKFRLYNIQPASTVRVYDVLGKQLMTFTVPDENYELDISTLKTGIYILKVIEGNRMESKIILKK